MFDGSDKAWCPSLHMSRKKEPRLLIAAFGDGYQQRTLDGVNAMNRTWTVQFEMKDAAVIADMETYLEGRKGAAFPFQDPADGKLYNVYCDSWQVDWLRIGFDVAGVRKYLNGTLSADFVQAYGLTVAGR